MGGVNMATVKFYGIDEYLSKLNQLGKYSIGLCKRALYDGAAVIADSVRAEVDALPTSDRDAKKGDPQPILEYEKQGLQEGLGVAKMRDEHGVIYTRIDFDGYNRLKSKKYPSGHPNSMVARAINSGTSKRKKNPFMSRAIRKGRAKAEAAMSARMDADINEIMK
jgi:HK97 gp10 family phage protein